VFTGTHFVLMNDMNYKFTMAWISGVISFLVFFFAAHLP
jgi:hypothetical protein